MAVMISMMIVVKEGAKKPRDYVNVSTKSQYKNGRISNYRLIRIINTYRQNGVNCGDVVFGSVYPLDLRYALTKSSFDKAYDMAVSGIFTHNGSGGMSDTTRKSTSRLKSYEKIIKHHQEGMLYYGESIVVGYEDERDMVERLLVTSKTCSIIMNKDFKYVGFNSVYSKTGLLYTTFHFSGDGHE
jgi:uncharacterized protein YkwD